MKRATHTAVSVAALACLGVAACCKVGPSASPPAAAATAPARSGAGLPEPPLAPTPTPTSSQPAHSPPTDIDPRIREAATSDEALAALLDPARGVAYVAHIEDRVEEDPRTVDGIIKSSELLCSFDEVAELVRKAVELAEAFARDCGNRAPRICVIAGSSNAFDIELHFSGDDASSKLVAVIEIQRATNSPSYITAAEAFVSMELARLRARDCADPSSLSPTSGDP